MIHLSRGGFYFFHKYLSSIGIQELTSFGLSCQKFAKACRLNLLAVRIVHPTAIAKIFVGDILYSLCGSYFILSFTKKYNVCFLCTQIMRTFTQLKLLKTVRYDLHCNRTECWFASP